MAKRNNYNSKALIDLTNSIMRLIPDANRETSLDIQKMIDDGLKKVIVSGASSKEEVLSEFIFDKKPPHNTEVEAAVLGKVMLFPKKALHYCTHITREFFYDQRHSLIWLAIDTLKEDQKNITPDGIFSILESIDRLENAGGKRYISALLKDQGSLDGLEDRVNELTDYFTLRSIWAQCAEAVHDVMVADSSDAENFRSRVMQGLANLAKNKSQKINTGIGLADKLAKLVEKIAEAQANNSKITGQQSSISALDGVTKGWQDTDLIVIAGRPAMGKTALAISDAHAAIKAGIPVAFFSLEMSAEQLAMRLAAIDLEMSVEDALKYKANELYTFIGEELPNLPIFIDDTPGVTWKYILDKSTYLQEKHGIRRIYVDYLQLMSPTDPKITNPEQIVAQNSQGMKLIAKTINCPVFLLSQLSRGPESRADKRPMLSDLRQSGAIEQDADMVIFTYRDEYYKIDTDDQGRNTEGVGELIIAKFRNGAVDTVRAFFNAPITYWTDLDRKPYTYNPKTTTSFGDEDVDTVF